MGQVRGAWAGEGAVEGRAAGGGRAGGWAGWAGRPHPIPCQALLLEWAKGHEGEWEGEASRQARRGVRLWAVGWLGGRARDKGGRRTKVSEWRNRPLLTSGCRSLECPGQSLLNGGQVHSGAVQALKCQPEVKGRGDGL